MVKSLIAYTSESYASSEEMWYISIGYIFKMNIQSLTHRIYNNRLFKDSLWTLLAVPLVEVKYLASVFKFNRYLLDIYSISVLKSILYTHKND